MEQKVDASSSGQCNADDGWSKAIVVADCALVSDLVNSPHVENNRVHNCQHSSDEEAHSSLDSGAVTKVEQTTCNGSQQDSNLDPRQERTLVGKVHLGLNADGHRDALALGHCDVGNELGAIRDGGHLGLVDEGIVEPLNHRQRSVVDAADNSIEHRRQVVKVAGVESGAGRAVAQQRRVFRCIRLGVSSGVVETDNGAVDLSDLLFLIVVLGVIRARDRRAVVSRALNTVVGVRRLADVDIHLGQPEGDQVDHVRQQGGSTVNELGELGNSLDQVRGNKLSDPLWGLLAQLGLQLDLKHSVREAFHVLLGELVEGPVHANVHTAPVAVGAVPTIKVIFTDHGQLGIERNTDTGVTRKLEGSTVVERADNRAKLGADGGVLDFSGQSLQRLNLLEGLLAVLAGLLKGLLDSVRALHEIVHVLLLEGETGLDGLFTSPVFTMGLSLDEDEIRVHTTVPSETNGLSTLGLFQTALVQVQVGVVVVNRGNCRVLNFKLLVGVEHKHRQVLEDNELELGDVVGMNPVLGGLTHKVLLSTTSRGVTLDGVTTRADQVVELGELDNKSIVVVLEEGLGVKTDGEDGLEGPLGHLIVLLDNLLEASVIETGELGQVMNIGNNIGQSLLEVLELLVIGRVVGVEGSNHSANLALGVLNAATNFAGLDLLEGVDLVEFGLQKTNKTLLVLISPFLVLGNGVFQVRLEFVVRYVVVVIVPGRLAIEPHNSSKQQRSAQRNLPDERGLELSAKLHLERVARGGSEEMK